MRRRSKSARKSIILYTRKVTKGPTRTYARRDKKGVREANRFKQTLSFNTHPQDFCIIYKVSCACLLLLMLLLLFLRGVLRGGASFCVCVLFVCLFVFSFGGEWICCSGHGTAVVHWCIVIRLGQIMPAWYNRALHASSIMQE